MNSPLSIGQNRGNYRWTICTLIFFATTINYLDRQVIAILKPLLESKLNITEINYGNIVMAFQLSYAIGLLFAGRLIDRIGTRAGYSISLALWSLASILHALVKSATGFVFMRSFLGLSESGNFPSAIKAVAEWFPKRERALATGIFNSGTNIGAIMAPLLVPWLAIKWGWKSAFIVVGTIGLLWLIFWFIFYEVPERHKRLSGTELSYILSDNEDEKAEKVSWIKLLGYRQTWAFIVGKFLTDPVWWFYLFWVPPWLASRVNGLDIKSFGLPLVVIYSCTTVGSIFGGALSGYFIARGAAVHKSRSYTMLLFAILVVPVMFVQSPGISLWSAIGLISLAASAHQAWSANIFTTVSDMFPKKAVASVTGIGGMAGALGGTLLAGFAGHILNFFSLKGNIQTGYFFLFLICGSAYLIAWILFRLLAPGMKKVEL